jgi:hypothetical protein
MGREKEMIHGRALIELVEDNAGVDDRDVTFGTEIPNLMHMGGEVEKNTRIEGLPIGAGATATRGNGPIVGICKGDSMGDIGFCFRVEE